MWNNSRKRIISITFIFSRRQDEEMNTHNLTRELAVVQVQRSVFLHVNCEAHASDPRKHVWTLLYMALNCQFGIKTYV